MSVNAGSPMSASSSTTQDAKTDLIRRPSLIMKPPETPLAGSPPPNAATTPMSLTSKEWVIPPRPKPGRKPATDTPPSKRKAQNRAAQRAFRERRAQRVSELEDQLKQVEDENDKDQDDLRSHITTLENENQHYRAELELWMDKCRRLENDLQAAKSNLPPLHSQSASDHVHTDTSVGCGKCTLDSRCQCIDDAFDAMGGTAMSSSDKRPHSPESTHPEKRIKTEADGSLEIDFTSMYSKPPQRSTTHQVSPSSAVADPCGFCSDGTPCICAEMAAEHEARHSHANNIPRPHLSTISQFTPPPSEGDVAIALPAPTQTPASSSCANGPGTCTQCQADPNSTLFCKSLAASRSQSTATSTAATGCCGGKTATGGCCQSPSTNSGNSSSTAAVPLPSRTTRSRTAAAAGSTTTYHLPQPPTMKTNVTLTCADAYTTLSRHPGYERASGEIASWMPKLHANDAPSYVEAKGVVGGGNNSRPAMEIDAANVMAVLKDFDRRFGRNC